MRVFVGTQQFMLFMQLARSTLVPPYDSNMDVGTHNCRQDGACMYKWAVRTTGEPQEAGLTPAAAFCTASW